MTVQDKTFIVKTNNSVQQRKTTIQYNKLFFYLFLTAMVLIFEKTYKEISTTRGEIIYSFFQEFFQRKTKF